MNIATSTLTPKDLAIVVGALHSAREMHGDDIPGDLVGIFESADATIIITNEGQS